jgi:hypothetical protein
MFTEVLRVTEIFVYVKDFPTFFASVLISHCVSTISFYVVVNTNEWMNEAEWLEMLGVTSGQLRRAEFEWICSIRKQFSPSTYLDVS